MVTYGSASKRAIKAKNPWAAWLTKVKGHAKDEDVEAGSVLQEDKEGNDKADEAADRGSKKEQQRIATATGLYSRRNKAYQTFVRQVQNISAQVKQEEARLRTEKQKETNPFESDAQKNIMIPKQPDYENENCKDATFFRAEPAKEKIFGYGRTA